MIEYSVNAPKNIPFGFMPIRIWKMKGGKCVAQSSQPTLGLDGVE